MIKRSFLLIVPPITYLTFIYFIVRFNYYIAGFLIAYFVPPAGKESIIPLMISYLHDESLAVLITILLITVTDSFTAFYVIWNFEIVLKIPKIGDVVRRIELKARSFIEEYELSRNTYLGIFVFVFIPFQGTGSTTASLIGKVLGLNNAKLFATIVSASLASSVFISMVSIYLTGYFKDYTSLIVVGVVVLIGITFRSIRKYRIYQTIVHETKRCFHRGSKRVGDRLHIDRDKEDSGK